MPPLWFTGALVAVFSAFIWVVARTITRLRVRSQLFGRRWAPVEAQRQVEQVESLHEMGRLRRWLFLAGFRRTGARPLFLGAALGAALLGGLAVMTLSRFGVLRKLHEGIEGLPGVLPDLFIPVTYVFLPLIFLVTASYPWLFVRGARRKRVTEIDRDLPLTLELLATLGEAGLGFDASVARILKTQDNDRPLTEELRIYRSETLAGIPRLRCLRRLAERVDVSSLTLVVSALLQAEQLGAGTAEVIRNQADDLRRMRRERAMGVAHALPVKLVFPLVICFLPAIFLAALGPAFAKFVTQIDNLVR